MRRRLANGYELDDDRDRVDVAAVYRFLAEEAYWVPGRDRATIERLVRGSTRVIAAYARDGSLAGFCRVVSDGSSMAWLGDVFVLSAHRGRGLGVALTREAVEDPAYRDLAWFLSTRDAHGLYRRFGFVEGGSGTLVRPRRSAAIGSDAVAHHGVPRGPDRREEPGMDQERQDAAVDAAEDALSEAAASDALHADAVEKAAESAMLQDAADRLAAEAVVEEAASEDLAERAEADADAAVKLAKDDDTG
jgi:ribosomal protein S18 acetylase RimI-like enzyme